MGGDIKPPVFSELEPRGSLFLVFRQGRGQKVLGNIFRAGVNQPDMNFVIVQLDGFRRR